jgi:3',5'-cyclic AMP phosphodiesterase CpdA
MISIEQYITKDIDKNTEHSLKSFADDILKKKKDGVFSFLFATDLHYKSNNELTFGTIKRLREMVMCAELVKPDLFVLNGDLTDGHFEKSKILSELGEIFDKLQDLNIPIIINKGNHDSATWFAYETKSADFIKAEEWNELISRVTKRDECGYGYLDFDRCKIRAIYLNTSDITNKTDELGRIIAADECEQWHLGIGEKQVNWLKNTISSCPCDYSVILFSHNLPCDVENPKSKVDNGESVWKIISDFNNKNNVLAYMYGHRHKDWTGVIDGITCICSKDMMNAQVRADDNTVFCATLKDIPIICQEPVFNNNRAEILGGWNYIEIDSESFMSRRFLNEELNREIKFANLKDEYYGSKKD